MTSTPDSPDRSSARFEYVSHEDAKQGLHTLLNTARHRIDAFAPRFEHAGFCEPKISQTLNHFAIQEPRGHARFLIVDEQWFLRFNSRMTEVFRRLSSYFQIRKLPPGFPFEAECFVVTDRRNVFHQADLSSPASTAIFDDPRRAYQFERKFEGYWQASGPLDELFTLGL